MKREFKNGKIYVSCSVLSFGDYDNSCAVERANVRVLKEKHPDFESYSMNDWETGRQYENREYVDIIPESAIVETYGGYGSAQIWIRSDIDEENGYTAALENYPCLNDEAVSEVEMEMEDEYIKDLWPNLKRCWPSDIQEALDLCDIDGIDREIYEKAKEETNTYFRVEAGGNGYIDCERIAPSYLDELIFKNPAIDVVKVVLEAKSDKPTFPVTFYDSAEDMFGHRDATGQDITAEEAREILRYAAELERQIEKVLP